MASFDLHDRPEGLLSPASQEGLELQPMTGGGEGGAWAQCVQDRRQGPEAVCRGLPRKDQGGNQPEDTDSANRRECPGPGRGERLAECEGLGGPGDLTGQRRWTPAARTVCENKLRPAAAAGAAAGALRLVEGGPPCWAIRFWWGHEALVSTEVTAVRLFLSSGPEPAVEAQSCGVERV